VVGLEVIKALLRFLSYLYHGLLCLLLMALSGVAMIGGGPALKMEMLPWAGSSLLHWMFFGGLAGLVILVLAIRGTLRPLFFVWALVVTVLLVKGYLLSNYHFSPAEFTKVLYLIGGSLIALLGAWLQMVRRFSKRA
jgi:hypothetical protein